MTVDGERLTLVNLYGPNCDNPAFYSQIFDNIDSFENDKIILCGDFNLVLDQS